MGRRLVLVTGGAGFIGSHLVDLLVEKGCDVRVYDNLDPQVHPRRKAPGYLDPRASLVRGDVRDQKKLLWALEGVDVVVHLAAAVGMGQSMYQVERYVSANTGGTAVLLDLLVNGNLPVKKLVVASSMSIYGEGKYQCQNCGPVYPGLRSEAQLGKRDWELDCPSCGRKAVPIPTDETKPLQPTAVYSMTKRHQEELCLLIGKTYGIPTVALRFFNVYGPRQTLSNPYTGVSAIFTSQILSGKPPYIFEDGGQRRDFVHVRDVANAVWMSLEKRAADFQVYNVGSGSSISIRELAEYLLRIHGSSLPPFVSNAFRVGDTRHCFADITKIRGDLGYAPTVDLEKGFAELAEWSRSQVGVQDRSGEAKKELERHGLVLG